MINIVILNSSPVIKHRRKNSIFKRGGSKILNSELLEKFPPQTLTHGKIIYHNKTELEFYIQNVYLNRVLKNLNFKFDNKLNCFKRKEEFGYSYLLTYAN